MRQEILQKKWFERSKECLKRSVKMERERLNLGKPKLTGNLTDENRPFWKSNDISFTWPELNMDCNVEAVDNGQLNTRHGLSVISFSKIWIWYETGTSADGPSMKHDQDMKYKVWTQNYQHLLTYWCLSLYMAAMLYPLVEFVDLGIVLLISDFVWEKHCFNE